MFYEVIRNSDKAHIAEVVIEYEVPAAGTNDASLQWQTIVAEIRAHEQSQGGAVPTSNPRRLTDAAYLAQLDAGEIVELPLTVAYNANLTLGQKAAAIDAAATAEIDRFTAGFSNRYAFYGIRRTV